MSEQELNSLGVQQRKVLEIVWELNGATVQEVLDRINAASEGPPLAYTTVLATMQKLEKAGWLRHEKDPENRRAYVYRAVRSRGEAIGSSLRAFADNFLDGDTALLFQHFVEDAGLSERELDEIRDRIREKRSRRKK